MYKHHSNLEVKCGKMSVKVMFNNFFFVYDDREYIYTIIKENNSFGFG